MGTPNRIIKRGFGQSRGGSKFGGMRAGKLQRNRLGAVIRHSQFAQPFSGGSNTHQGRSYLPLAGYRGHLTVVSVRARRRAGGGG